MAGNIASAGGLRHVCGCAPARPDAPSARAKKSSLFSSLEEVGAIACEPRARPLFRQFDDIVKLEHRDHLTRRSK